MSRKQVNIIIILALAVVAIFVGLGFIGIGGFGQSTAPQTTQTGAQAILSEIQQTGTVADLRIEDSTLGTGDPVVAGDTVSVTYIGVLPDGTVFDSSDMHGGVPLTFTVGAGKVIPGWDQGLVGMKVGGQRLLAVPPSLGYGGQAIGKIPANATLLFEIQLLKRVPAGTSGTTATSSTKQ